MLTATVRAAKLKPDSVVGRWDGTMTMVVRVTDGCVRWLMGPMFHSLPGHAQSARFTCAMSALGWKRMMEILRQMLGITIKVLDVLSV